MEKAAAPTYVVAVLGPLADPAPLGSGGLRAHHFHALHFTKQVRTPPPPTSPPFPTLCLSLCLSPLCACVWLSLSLPPSLSPFSLALWLTPHSSLVQPEAQQGHTASILILYTRTAHIYAGKGVGGMGNAVVTCMRAWPGQGKGGGVRVAWQWGS